MLMAIMRRARHLVQHEDAATMPEYALMIALIAIVCVVAVTTIGTNSTTVFTSAATGIANAGG
jgi:pilus assembly protein Flp/PilA